MLSQTLEPDLCQEFPEGHIFGSSCSPFDLQMIQLPPRPPAPACPVAEAPLHHIQHLSRNLCPRVRRALDVVLLQLLFVSVVGVYHHLPLGVLPEYHVGPEDAAQLAQETEGVVEEQVGCDVDHQHQLAQGELLRHVVGAVQTVPLALSIVATLVAVAIGVVVLAVLVIQRTKEKSENV